MILDIIEFILLFLLILKVNNAPREFSIKLKQQENDYGKS